MVLATVKILIHTARGKAVELGNRLLQPPASMRSIAASSESVSAHATVRGTTLPTGRLANEYFSRYCASKII